MRNKPSPLIAIFLTVFLDMMAFGMAIPDLQLRGESLGLKGWHLGLVMAAYSIAQLLTAPFLGRISDYKGRRPVLIISTILSLFSFIVYIFAGHWAIFLASRILGGIGGANIGVAFAYVADVTTPENRAKGMGIVGAAFGLGFIFGPPIGAMLVEANNGGPMILGAVAAFMTIINLVFLLMYLPEPEREIPVHKPGLNPLQENWLNVRNAFRYPELRILLVLFLVAGFAFSNLESTFFRMVTKDFLMSEREGAYVLVWVGIVGAFMQGYLIRIVAPKFGEANLMRFGYLLQVPALISIAFCPPWVPMLLCALVLGIGTGVAGPSTSSLISRLAPPEARGGIFGIMQSLGAVARVIGPIVGSSLFEGSSKWPYIAAGLIMLVPAGLALFVKMPEGESDGDVVIAH